MGSPKPNKVDKNNYIGLEIECFGKISQSKLEDIIIDAKLPMKFSIGDDSSIKSNLVIRTETLGYDDWNYNREYRQTRNIYAPGYEIKCLIKEKDLYKCITQLYKLLKKHDIQVNHTCGLHVHIDMRNRDVEKSYYRLFKHQSYLTMCISKDRLSNDFTMPNMYYMDRDDHYNAISYDSYRKFKTLEVRMHEATLDSKAVYNWVSLLLGIVKQDRISSNLKSYYSKKFNKIQYKKVS